MNQGDIDLPEGWEVRPLGEVATTQLGKTIDPRQKNGPRQRLYLRNANVQWGAFDLEDVATMHFSPEESSKYRLEPGDLLICEGGVAGRGAIWPGTVADCHFQNALHRVRPRDSAISTEWLLENVRHLSDIGLVADRARGNTIQHLSQHELRLLPILVPKRATQDRLVEAMARIRTAKTSAGVHLSAARKAIERFRHAVLATACSGRLTADWRDANPCETVAPGPALSPQATRNASGSPNSNDHVDIPATWAWWSIEAITERVIDYRGRTPPSVPSGPIPHVRTTQIRQGRIDWNTDRFITQTVYDEYMTRGLPERGDVLFTMEAPMGDVGVVNRDEPFSIAQRILLMRPGPDLDGDFLCLSLRSHPVQRAIEYRATGSGVLGIAYKRLRSVVLPKPPLDEQREVVRRTSQLLALADDVEGRLNAAGQRVDRSSQAVLAKAFRGELLEVRREQEQS